MANLPRYNSISGGNAIRILTPEEVYDEYMAY